MKSKKKELISIPVSDLLKVDALTATTLARFPEKRGAGLILEGDIGDLTEQLVKILKEKTAVLN